MNDVAKKPETPEERKAREEAELPEQKYGGRDRWIFTILTVICLGLTIYLLPTKSPHVVITIFSGVTSVVLAAINWRAWLKKSETEKAAARRQSFRTLLEIKPLSVPFTRADFENPVKRRT